MKQILVALALSALALSAQAQTTTNLAWRVTIESVTAGVTNTSQSTVRLDYGTKKEALLIDGLVKAHNDYVKGGGTATFEAWLKTDIKDRAKVYADAKQAADNAALLSKLTALLTSNLDLLSNADITSLTAIAAKLP
jgi:hypothetical protein